MSRYDVFEVLSGGDVLWHQAADDLAEAKNIAEEKVAQTRNPFIILNQLTQATLLIRAHSVQTMPEAEDRAKNSVAMNNTMELPFPEWQGPLQEALVECDREKLADKALKAETQILERLAELQQSNNGLKEREAIDFGLSLLRKIRCERLDYPDWQ